MNKSEDHKVKKENNDDDKKINKDEENNDDDKKINKDEENNDDDKKINKDEENNDDDKKINKDEENNDDDKKINKDEENNDDDKKINKDEENNDDDKKINKDEENQILKEELKKAKADLKKCIDESANNFIKLKYLMADFDNYRKQADKMVQTSITNNKANIISKFLNIKDDYLRALEIAKKSTNTDETIISGLDSILKNFDSILSSEGLEQIETFGKIFDPNIHDVVSFSYNNDLSENIITNEVRVGYTLDGKVLRPSLVIINKNN